MSRPKKCRRICALPKYEIFGPVETEVQGVIEMAVEEYETIRLIDLLGWTQENCALQMGVARSTVQQIYDTARRKIALALTEGHRLMICGGNYTLCAQTEQCKNRSRTRRGCMGPRCGRRTTGVWPE